MTDVCPGTGRRTFPFMEPLGGKQEYHLSTTLIFPSFFISIFITRYRKNTSKAIGGTRQVNQEELLFLLNFRQPMTFRWRRSWTSSASSRLVAALTCPTWPLFRLATSSATIWSFSFKLLIIVMSKPCSALVKAKARLVGREAARSTSTRRWCTRPRTARPPASPPGWSRWPCHDYHEYKVNMFNRTEARARATRTSATKRWTWSKRTLVFTGGFNQINCIVSDKAQNILFLWRQ